MRDLTSFGPCKKNRTNNSMSSDDIAQLFVVRYLLPLTSIGLETSANVSSRSGIIGHIVHVPVMLMLNVSDDATK